MSLDPYAVESRFLRLEWWWECGKEGMSDSQGPTAIQNDKRERETERDRVERDRKKRRGAISKAINKWYSKGCPKRLAIQPSNSPTNSHNPVWPVSCDHLPNPTAPLHQSHKKIVQYQQEMATYSVFVFARLNTPKYNKPSTFPSSSSTTTTLPHTPVFFVCAKYIFLPYPKQKKKKIQKICDSQIKQCFDDMMMMIHKT